MVFESLLRRLQERFPDGAFASTPHAVTFPAANSHVGEIEIVEDGPELIVYLGHFTHAHFANYDKSLSAEQAAKNISENVIALLEDVFADRIVFWGSHRGGGGYYLRGDQPSSVFARNRGQEYVWSGPISSQG
jgi:hypothetical protein